MLIVAIHKWKLFIYYTLNIFNIYVLWITIVCFLRIKDMVHELILTKPISEIVIYS